MENTTKDPPKKNFPFCTADPSRPAALLLLELALPVLRRHALPDGRLDAAILGSYSFASPKVDGSNRRLY